MTLQERIGILSELGDFLRNDTDNEALMGVIQQTWIENRWFTPENIREAIAAIADTMLKPELLEKWAAQYPISSSTHPEHTIGLVMAGNIPLVGFHDWLCVFLSGARAKVKLSEKDKNLLPFLIQKMGEWAHESREYTIFCAENEPLRGFDAVIATGSNNTARYFEQYFAKYPHIIRRNRNAVGVIDGSETFADFYALGRDIFAYFGLGCRNVSKIYVPRSYVFDPMLEALHEYKELANHDKYRNNFDYNTTLLLLNSRHYLNNGCIILLEDVSLNSRIATVHYEYYDDSAVLADDLRQKSEEIQCIVGKLTLPGISVLPFGQSQSPTLNDYPDGVDVMHWLTTLDKS
jgi:Acyl-CoA reductase (LuxC)